MFPLSLTGKTLPTCRPSSAIICTYRLNTWSMEYQVVDTLRTRLYSEIVKLLFYLFYSDTIVLIVLTCQVCNFHLRYLFFFSIASWWYFAPVYCGQRSAWSSKTSETSMLSHFLNSNAPNIILPCSNNNEQWHNVVSSSEVAQWHFVEDSNYYVLLCVLYFVINFIRTTLQYTAAM